MNRYIKRLLPLCTMLVFPFLGMMYQWVNVPTNNVYSFMTDLDRAIPIVRFFVLPYSIWILYIYVCLIYFFIKDPKTYYRSLLMYIVCSLICFSIYSVFQTTVPRPILTEDDVFTRLLAFVYDRDLPFNCFPSIHCFSCYMVMKSLYHSEFRNRLNQKLIYGMSTLIICSTFLVKQHAIIDALAGFFIVEIVYLAIISFEIGFKTSWNKRGETWGSHNRAR
jgi:hypothetical protein